MPIFPDRMKILHEIGNERTYGIPFSAPPYGRNYVCLRNAVNDAAVTTEAAAGIMGVSVRHFKRIISGPRFKHISIWGIVKVGGIVLYDRIAVEWWTKEHRIGKIREELKRSNISKSRRRSLLKKLHNQKLLYIYQTDFDTEREDFDSWLSRMEAYPGLKMAVDRRILREFGPDCESEWDEFYSFMELAKVVSNIPSLREDEVMQ